MPSQKINLISIPYAGGNGYSFNGWKPYLPDTLELVTIELPGRGKRVFEKLLLDIDDMVDDLYDQLQPWLQEDYLLYGHSMGGTLGNLLLHKLQEENQRLPLHALFTGCAAPKLKKYDRPLHRMNDADFIQALKDLGGFPDEILASDELMAFLLPIIRADMTALERNQYQEMSKYTVPLTVIAGTEEKITEEQLEAWQEETDQVVETLRYPGNHFFILRYYQDLAALMQQKHAALLI